MIAVPVRVGPGVLTHALVDDHDRWILNWNWFLSSHGYPTCIRKDKDSNRNFRMHRVILGLVHGDDREVDHENGDKLDNRRSNIRILTRDEHEAISRQRAINAGSVWTKERICASLREWSLRNGRPPKPRDLRKVKGTGYPCESTIHNHFQSWSAALEAAGLIPSAVGSPQVGPHQPTLSASAPATPPVLAPTAVELSEDAA